jgi:hypothetical protein
MVAVYLLFITCFVCNREMVAVHKCFLVIERYFLFIGCFELAMSSGPEEKQHHINQSISQMNDISNLPLSHFQFYTKLQMPLSVQHHGPSPQLS